MAYKKAYDYLKELARTHPKAFKLGNFSREYVRGEVNYTVNFAIDLPFTRGRASVMFETRYFTNDTYRKSFIESLDKMILNSNYKNLKDDLTCGHDNIFAAWSIYKEGFSYTAGKIGLTKASTFFNNMPKELKDVNAVLILNRNVVLEEVNSFVTSQVYQFVDYNTCLSAINEIRQTISSHINKQLASHLTESSKFTFTTSLMPRNMYAKAILNVVDGDSFEFQAGYLSYLMPFIEPVDDTVTNNNTTDFDL